MADEERIFEDGENLQAAIGKAIQESKALLCFVSDDGDGSSEWEIALFDEEIRTKLLSTTVLLRLQAGSDQAGFLNGVCPIQSIPAIVIIHNAQVIGNYQNAQISFDQLQRELKARYGFSREGESAASTLTDDEVSHLDFPAPAGRMRLPNNVYDQIRKLTEESVSKGQTGKTLLQVQLLLLRSLNIDIVTKAVDSIQQQITTVTAPALPAEVTDRLLNTPASRLQDSSISTEQKYGGSSSQNPTSQAPVQMASSSAASSSSVPTPERQEPSWQSQQSTNTTTSILRPSSTPSSSSQTQSPSSSSTSQATQRSQYIAAQKSRENAASAERARIKASIAADKAARREAEAASLAEQRRAELQNLRKANSTTSNPKPSDVRIQVRLFDGSTIRNSFPAEATVSRDVRGWIDGEVAKNAVGSAQQPYNLKLILTPLPNRTVEAGEEDAALSDIEGVRGSATMVMVPVRGYVESYSGASGGIVGGVGSVVGAGFGLVGAAAGMVVGGLGRLLGATGALNPAQHAPVQAEGGNTEATGPGGANAGASRSNMRVRTLADQRIDEEDEARRKGTQLYNGMGLNVQPRKDEDDDKKR